MRKLGKVSARLSFSLKYCREVAGNAIKLFVSMYQETISIFWGLKIQCGKFIFVTPKVYVMPIVQRQ